MTAVFQRFRLVFLNFSVMTFLAILSALLRAVGAQRLPETGPALQDIEDSVEAAGLRRPVIMLVCPVC